jgi:hypothetical protein
MLAREVRHIDVHVAVDDRDVDDPLDPGLARQVERDQRLGEFVGDDRVEQEQGAHAVHSRPHRLDVGQIAHRQCDAVGQFRLGGIADERA